MKKMIMVLVLMILATAVVADPAPVYTFDNETCILTVNPNANALDGWFVCVSTDGLDIGLHNTAEALENCGHIVEIPADGLVDLEGIAFCDIATATDTPTWGTIKVIFR